MSKRTGWEHYDLEKEISNANMAQLLELFSREETNFTKACMNYVDQIANLTEEGNNNMKDAIALINEGRKKVALEIALRLTKTDMRQREVVPSNLR